MLVTGASGAVGGFAVQLAAQLVGRSSPVASYGDESRVRQLGASHVISHTSDPGAAPARWAPTVSTPCSMPRRSDRS